MENHSGIERPFRLMPRQSAFRLCMEGNHHPPVFASELPQVQSSSCFSTPVATNESISTSDCPFPEPPVNQARGISKTESRSNPFESTPFRHNMEENVSFAPPPKRFKIPNCSLPIRPKTLTKESWILREAQEVRRVGGLPLLFISENVLQDSRSNMEEELPTTPKVEYSSIETMENQPPRHPLFPQHFYLELECHNNLEKSRILLPDDF